MKRTFRIAGVASGCRDGGALLHPFFAQRKPLMSLTAKPGAENLISAPQNSPWARLLRDRPLRSRFHANLASRDFSALRATTVINISEESSMKLRAT